LKFIDGLPPDVLAVEAKGKVTHEDYQHTLIPKAEAMMAKGPIKMLYVLVVKVIRLSPATMPIFCAVQC
jgi:SpoIIAA-like